jgi:hypothetical protein
VGELAARRGAQFAVQSNMSSFFLLFDFAALRTIFTILIAAAKNDR